MHDYLAQSLLHAAVTLAVVETLLATWRLSAPSIRLAARLGALAVPTVITPVLLLLAPGRGEQAFRLDRAWFDSTQWHAFTLAGTAVDDWAIAVACLVGLVLFARDLRALMAVQPSRYAAAIDVAGPERLARVAAARGLGDLPLLVTAEEAPLLFVRSARQPRVIVSNGALRRLDDDELGVALAHEQAHVLGGDVRLGWWLGVACLLQAFNPFVHVLARAAIAEMERRADRRACRSAHDEALLASARRKLLFGDGVTRADFGPAIPTGRGGAPAVDRHDAPELGARSASWGMATAVLAVSVLVYFVV